MALSDPDLGEEYHKNCSTCPGEASSFCQDCDKYFCATCLPVHNSLLTDHTVLADDQRQEWGKKKEKKKWTKECDEHAGQLTCMYCSKHDSVCCPVCAVQKHGFGFGCTLAVSFIPDIAKGLSSSLEYKAHLEHVDNVIARVNATEQELKEKVHTQLHDSKVRGSEIMKELIEQINKMLNELMNESLKKLDENDDRLDLEVGKEIGECLTGANELEVMKKELRNAEQYDEVDLFICMKTSQKQTDKLDTTLDALESKYCNQIKFSTDDKVEKAVKLLEMAESLGTLQSIQQQPERNVPKGDDRGQIFTVQTTNQTPKPLIKRGTRGKKHVQKTSVSSMSGISTTSSSLIGIPSTASMSSSSSISGSPSTRTSQFGTKTPVDSGMFTDADGSSFQVEDSPLLFHQVHGKCVKLSEDRRHAQRITTVFSKNMGLCFSSRPMAFGERIRLKVELNSLFTNSLIFGLTRTDPAHLDDSDLDRSKSKGMFGNLLKSIERLPQNTFQLFFYVTEQGDVFYGVNDKEIGLMFHGIETNAPLWAIIDISVLKLNNSIEFVMPNFAVENSMASNQVNTHELKFNPTKCQRDLTMLETKETRKNHILQHGQGKDGSSPLLFNFAFGENASVSDDQMTATRKLNHTAKCYVFTTRPIKVKETMIIEVQDIFAVGYLHVGFTSCDPATLRPEDITNEEHLLLKRPEYWSLSSCKVVTEAETIFHLYLTENGTVQCCEKMKPPFTMKNHWVSSLMEVDTSQPLWALIVMGGGLQKVRIIERKSETRTPSPPSIGISTVISSGSSGNAPFSTTVAYCPKSLTSSSQNTPGATNLTFSQLAAKHQENATTNQTSVPAATAPTTALQTTAGGGFSLTPISKSAVPHEEKQKEEVKVTTPSVEQAYSGFSFTTPTQSPKKSPSSATKPTYSSSVSFPMMPQNAVASLDPKPDRIYCVPARQASASISGPSTSLTSCSSATEATSTSQTSILAAASIAKPQETPLRGFSFTSTRKITEQKTDKLGEEMKVKTSAYVPKSSSGFPFTTPTQSPAKPQENTLAGFSLTSNPKITAIKADKVGEETKVDTSADVPNTFSGFQFTKQTQSPAQSRSTETKTACLSAKFGADYFKGLTETDHTTFIETPSSRICSTSSGSVEYLDTFEPNVDFKPVVTLPDLVDLKTGEEDEEKLFQERAELFRYDDETKQWKERGVGDIKILKHNVTNVHRILMRREQVLKLCANHRISKDLKLTPMSTSEKAWVWTAADFSEREVKTEKIAVRFRNKDLAAKFKKIVETCKENIVMNDTEFDEKKTKEEKKVGKKERNEEAIGKTCDLASLIKPTARSWTCTGCYVQNNDDILQCTCCNTLKPGGDTGEKYEAPKETALSSESGFSETRSDFTFNGVYKTITDDFATSSSTDLHGNNDNGDDIIGETSRSSIDQCSINTKPPGIKGPFQKTKEGAQESEANVISASSKGENTTVDKKSYNDDVTCFKDGNKTATEEAQNDGVVDVTNENTIANKNTQIDESDVTFDKDEIARVDEIIQGSDVEVVTEGITTSYDTQIDEVIVVKEEKATEDESTKNDDVIFVKEENTTPNEISQARELQLPDHFFMYRRKPECSGCRGCREEDSHTSNGQTKEDNADDYDKANDDYYDEEEKKLRSEELTGEQEEITNP